MRIRRLTAAVGVAAALASMWLTSAVPRADAQVLADPPAGSTSSQQASSEAAIALRAVMTKGAVAKVDWNSFASGVTSWRVGRNGTDDSGTGAWSTTLAGTARSYSFYRLLPGTIYTFTVTPFFGTRPGTARQISIKAGIVGTASTPEGTTAAVQHGWGDPLAWSDEFNYRGRADLTKWYAYEFGMCYRGYQGNGRICGHQSSANGSAMVQTGTVGGDTGWIGSRFDQSYGRWEVRVRSVGASQGKTYHPVLIIWPEQDKGWPAHGEYDFLENSSPGQPCAKANLHYPHPVAPPVQQEQVTETNCGAPLSEWHNVAFEWTPDHVKGFIDGKEWYTFSGGGIDGVRRDIQTMTAGHLTMQFDNYFGTTMVPGTFEVDWVRIYPLR